MRDEKLQRSRALRIGVDTGGTFTDFVASLDSYHIAFKVSSTPEAPAGAILSGILRVLSDPALAQMSIRNLGTEIAHGTTVATNALLERKGARTALITTAGFEDVIQIGRQARPDLYNLNVTRPAPLVPRELRFGVAERIDLDGKILEVLDRAEVDTLRGRLQRANVESIAICLLFSFANPVHEQQIAEALRPLALPLSISHEILPEYREYERTSTVVVNAYLAPRVGQYLRALREGLKAHFAPTHLPRLRIMQSSGGSISAEVAAREPVRTILSGPAGGVVASLKIAELSGVSDIITFDMGGTSTDVALCRGVARTTNESHLADLPVAVPVLDIHTVGAGGGSIAYIDAGGALRVGPQSAGAMPGPACYGIGMLPTVTDANLLLGRFGGGDLLAGQMKLDMGRAAVAIDQLARDLGRASGKRVSRSEAALGIINVANTNMEQALRLVSTERGYDPRRFSLVSFGGAGGLHAVALAESLRIPQVLVPADPGNFSALGVLLADVVRDYSRTVMVTLAAGERPGPDIERTFRSLSKTAVADLRAEGFTGAMVKTVRSMAVRYRGQSFELEVPWSADFAETFHASHRNRYGHGDATNDIEIVNLRLRAIGMTSKPVIPHHDKSRRKRASYRNETQLRIARRTLTAPVYDRGQLGVGTVIKGPAVIREYGSTTLIPPGWQLEVDGWRSLVVTPTVD